MVRLIPKEKKRGPTRKTVKPITRGNMNNHPSKACFQRGFRLFLTCTSTAVLTGGTSLECFLLKQSCNQVYSQIFRSSIISVITTFYHASNRLSSCFINCLIRSSERPLYHRSRLCEGPTSRSATPVTPLALERGALDSARQKVYSS